VNSVNEYKDLLQDIAEAYWDKNKKRLKRRVEAVAAMFPAKEPKPIGMCLECRVTRQHSKGLCSECYYKHTKATKKARLENAE